MRALAQAAHRIGYRQIIAVDLFGDADTQSVATECYCPANRTRSGFDVVKLRGLLQDLHATRSRADALFGSGIEQHYELIPLAPNWRWLSCPPTLIGEVRNFRKLSRVLGRLAIPYPDTRWERPSESAQGWLAKCNRTSGGQGVSSALRGSAQKADYWQREVQGAVVSILFCAWPDAQWERIGYSRQLQVPASRDRHRFRFEGVVSGVVVDEENKLKIKGYIDKLINSFNFIGLIGIDFILAQGQCLLLEVNPRPTATMELFDRIHGDLSLLERHRTACQGTRLADVGVYPVGGDSIAGMQIVYAQSRQHVNDQMAWPPWAADLPTAGQTIGVGAPMCSVFACHSNEQQVMRELATRAQKIEDLLRQQ